MKYNEYKILEEKINNQDFNNSYKTINIILTIFSYFGHIASISLAYFMLSKVIISAMTGNIIVAGISSVIILTTLELLKRNMFNRFSISFLKLKGITKEVLPLFSISLLIISLSFYASIKGAAEFSSKSAEIEVKGKETIQIYNDSLNKVYNDEIKLLEDSFKTKDEILTNLQTLALSKTLSKDQRLTISDLSTQKKDIQQTILNKKTELSTNIKNYESVIVNDSTNQKENNNKSSLLFVIISSLIELIILAGIYFNEYYKFKSYNDYRNKLDKDPNYQKWLLYNQMLHIIYTEDTKINQKLPSNKSIIDMCKANNILVLNKDLTDFLKIITNIGIIKVSGSAKYINKTKDLAEEYLRKQYNIE